MTHIIHSIRTADGTHEYRIWSTQTDSYLTDSMTEEELREHVRLEAIAEALRQFDRDIEGRLERARTKGTSHRLERRDDIETWEEERDDETT